MGDSRFRHHYLRVRDAPDRAAEMRRLPDEAVIAALAACKNEGDAYLRNVLATEAMNRVRRARSARECCAHDGRGTPLDLEQALGEIGHGTHLCLVYETREEQSEAAVTYIRQGLERRERCVYIADENSATEIGEMLSDHGVDTGAEIAAGSLSIITKRDAYLRGGVFEPDRMLEFLERSLEDALADGYAGLRVTGEMTWALDPSIDPAKLLEYESKLNAFFRGRAVSAICQYNRARFDPQVMVGVIHTHPLVVYGGLVCDNFYYVPPEDFGMPETSAVQIDRLLENIRARAAAEREVLRLNRDLERVVAERTCELKSALQELESFSYAVSHDLRAPLRGMDFYAQALEEDYSPALDAEGKEMLQRLRGESQRLSTLVTHLLHLGSVSRAELRPEPLDITRMAKDVLATLARADKDRRVEVEVEEGVVASGDPHLVRLVLENLLGNAWKFTRHAAAPRIVVRTTEGADGEPWIEVADNGAGFDPARADRLFLPFTRLHSSGEFEGTGVGLATVARIIRRHEGRICAEGKPGRGATFKFTLSKSTALRQVAPPLPMA